MSLLIFYALLNAYHQGYIVCNLLLLIIFISLLYILYSSTKNHRFG